MFLKTQADAPTRTRPGLASHVLLQRGDVADTDLAVTWVDVDPGEAQERHHPPPEQVYVFTRGTGRMHAEGEARDVAAGDLVRIPPGAPHFVENTGDELLLAGTADRFTAAANLFRAPRKSNGDGLPSAFAMASNPEETER